MVCRTAGFLGVLKRAQMPVQHLYSSQFQQGAVRILRNVFPIKNSDVKSVLEMLKKNIKKVPTTSFTQQRLGEIIVFLVCGVSFT